MNECPVLGSYEAGRNARIWLEGHIGVRNGARSHDRVMMGCGILQRSGEALERIDAYRLKNGFAILEVGVKRHRANANRGRDLAHGYVDWAALGEQCGSGLDHAGPDVATTSSVQVRATMSAGCHCYVTIGKPCGHRRRGAAQFVDWPRPSWLGDSSFDFMDPAAAPVGLQRVRFFVRGPRRAVLRALARYPRAPLRLTGC